MHSKPATTKLFHVLHIETLKVIYFIPFHSLLKFGIIFWGNSTTIHKVFIVQKKDIKNYVGNRLKMFLWRLVYETNYFASTMHIYTFLLIISVFNNFDDLKLIHYCMILILKVKISYIFYQWNSHLLKTVSLSLL